MDFCPTLTRDSGTIRKICKTRASNPATAIQAPVYASQRDVYHWITTESEEPPPPQTVWIAVFAVVKHWHIYDPVNVLVLRLDGFLHKRTS